MTVDEINSQSKSCKRGMNLNGEENLDMRFIDKEETYSNSEGDE